MPSFANSQTKTVSHWGAVFSLFMGVTSLIAAEFIPVSLLTPIALDLNVTEGMVGQSVTAVGIFAVFASLSISPLTKMIDRKKVLLSLSFLLVISNLIVAVTPNYLVLLIGRGLLGICVGGFWSMASAVTLQLVPQQNISKALSIVYAGVSVATIISLPLASYLGEVIGWRNVFYLAALLGAIAFLWQAYALPTLAPQKGNSFNNMFTLLKQNWILTGIIATIFSYSGYHIVFTYLRPLLELNLALSPQSLTIALLAFGIANCLGTFVAGFIMGKQFSKTMLLMQLIFLALALALYFSHVNTQLSIILLMLWGFMFGFIPVGWSTWITRTLSDQAELVGGLSVAAIQFSIGFAAAIGGLILDHSGIYSIFVVSTLIFIGALLFTKTSFTLFYKRTGHLV